MVAKSRQYRLVSFVKLVMAIPLGIMTILAAYSLLLGWNLLTAVTFWFLIVPFLVFFLSKVLGIRHLWQSFIALLCFYGVVIFMTYEHFRTDFYAVLFASLIFNSFVMMFVILVDRHDRISRQN